MVMTQRGVLQLKESEKEVRREPISKKGENVARWWLSPTKWDDGNSAAQFWWGRRAPITKMLQTALVEDNDTDDILLGGQNATGLKFEMVALGDF
jgi:hypothetical protein